MPPALHLTLSLPWCRAIVVVQRLGKRTIDFLLALEPYARSSPHVNSVRYLAPITRGSLPSLTIIYLKQFRLPPF